MLFAVVLHKSPDLYPNEPDRKKKTTRKKRRHEHLHRTAPPLCVALPSFRRSVGEAPPTHHTHHPLLVPTAKPGHVASSSWTHTHASPTYNRFFLLQRNTPAQCVARCANGTVQPLPLGTGTGIADRRILERHESAASYSCVHTCRGRSVSDGVGFLSRAQCDFCLDPRQDGPTGLRGMHFGGSVAVSTLGRMDVAFGQAPGPPHTDIQGDLDERIPHTHSLRTRSTHTRGWTQVGTAATSSVGAAVSRARAHLMRPRSGCVITEKRNSCPSVGVTKKNPRHDVSRTKQLSNQAANRAAKQSTAQCIATAGVALSKTTQATWVVEFGWWSNVYQLVL